MAKRTTLRSKSGRKLYAVRTADGEFKDIQTYRRAHATDMRWDSKAEGATATRKSAMNKPVRKKAAKRK